MRSILLVTLLASTSVLLGQTNQVLPPLVANPGRTITLNSPSLANGDKISVKLHPVPPGPGMKAACDQDKDLVPIQVAIQGTQTSVTFGIPPDTCLGLYLVQPKQQNGDKTGDLQISSPQYVKVEQAKPDVTGVSPLSLVRDDALPNDNPGAANQVPVYLVTFLGANSLPSDQGAKYNLKFVDRPLLSCDEANQANANPNAATNATAAAGNNPGSDSSCYQFLKSANGQVSFKVKGSHFLPDFAGRRKVSLVLDGAESDPQQIDIINASKATPRNWAIGITLALIVLIYILLSGARKAVASRTGRGKFLLTALFLDEQTQTYSLSKCQFYVWTIAAVLGYVFFAVARSVVQGSAVFPDIPGGLPGILLYSAGTSVLATGITSNKGSKGAGEIHPSLADFITTGGVVAPERLQFVVWTAVGVFTFLTIVFKSDPLTLSNLPDIPTGFLELMGISSAAYLGGKLARKPGPVITVISVANVAEPAAPNAAPNVPDQYSPKDGVTPSGVVLTLNVQGQNLDPKAKIKINDQPLRGDQFWINGTPDPQSGFCSELNISLNAAAQYLEGSYQLTVVNGDGQASDVMFPKDTMTITSVDPPTAQNPAFVVKGTNFVANTSYEWHAANDALLGARQVATFKSPNELDVNPPPAPAAGAPALPQRAKLVLISPAGLRISKADVPLQ